MLVGLVEPEGYGETFLALSFLVGDTISDIRLAYPETLKSARKEPQRVGRWVLVPDVLGRQVIENRVPLSVALIVEVQDAPILEPAQQNKKKSTHDSTLL